MDEIFLRDFIFLEPSQCARTKIALQKGKQYNLDKIANMPPKMQSKMNRLAKEQEQTTCVRNQLIGTEELPLMFDFIDCISTAIMKKFKFLMEMQNHILGEMSKTLKVT